MTESKGPLGDIEMSKLDELIAELCPDGVEYKTLGETVGVNRGKRLVKSQLSDNGAYEVYHGSKESILGRYDQYNAPANTTIVVNTGGIGGVKFLEKPFWCSDGSFWLGKSSEINSKYLYYCLSGYEDYFYSQKRVGGVPTIDRSVIENFQIPVPPLPVQEEIVRILDKFTSLTAELTARRKQYEYYRDALLSFGKVSPPLTFGLDGSKICWTTLEHICKNICSGGTPNTSQQEYYQGNIPWLRTQEIDWKDIYDTHVKITQSAVDSSSAKWIPANCVIVAMYGATAAKVAINKIPLTTNQACCNLEIDANLANYRYVFHWLQHKYLELKALGQGSQSNINAKIIKAFLIPLPPLSVQQRIVNVLDNFDAICSDLKIGLPAEIDARKKQYEYYRDKLLSFDTNVNNILHGGG